MRVGSAAMSSSSSTRPLAQKATGAAKRALHRLAGTKRGRQAEDSLGDGGSAAGLDEWLVPLFGDELNRIDAVVKGAGVEGYGEFRGLDDDLWSLLLTLEYEAFPNIREFLPGLPEPALQQMWNGTSGPALAAQSVCFYRKLKEMLSPYGTTPLN